METMQIIPTTIPKNARGWMVVSGKPVNFTVLDDQDGDRLTVCVTNLNGLNTPVRVGEILSIPAARLVAWTM
jgi:hypothetical protein